MSSLRHLPGTKAGDFHRDWPVLDAGAMPGTLAVQQLVQQQLRVAREKARRGDPVPVEALVTAADDQDVTLWQYEQLRQFTIDLNELTVRMMGECTMESCPRMKATSEWLYLRAAHRMPKECSAIDYCRHTLDGTGRNRGASRRPPVPHRH